MKNSITVLLLLSALPVLAQREIKIDDAKNHVGETVKIYTKIFGGKYFEKDSLTLLNAGGYYPGAPLTIVIRGSARNEFNTPEVYFKGAEVCVTGRIELYRDHPQIEVKSKDQVKEVIRDQMIRNGPK